MNRQRSVLLGIIVTSTFLLWCWFAWMYWERLFWLTQLFVTAPLFWAVCARFVVYGKYYFIFLPFYLAGVIIALTSIIALLR